MADHNDYTIEEPGIRSIGRIGRAVVVCCAIVLLPLTALRASEPKHVISSALPTAFSREATASSPYRGLGTWVDIYDSEVWARPEAAVQAMHAEGVRTVFIETANHSSPHAIFDRRALDRIVHAAHRLHLNVVGWYLPSFADFDADLHRSLAAIRYHTNQGQRLDGFALDIEATVVSSVTTRIQRLLVLSHAIRAAVRSSYSLGAIVPSPFGMKRAPWYWGRPRDFPYRDLASVYDVIAPMSYFTYRVNGMQQVHDYTAFNIDTIRHFSGDARVPLHPIGGIAAHATRAEVRGYVRALREGRVLGGGLYDFRGTHSGQWPILRQIPVKPL